MRYITVNASFFYFLVHMFMVEIKSAYTFVHTKNLIS